MKKLIFCLAAISVVAVSAMPTKKEVTAAREVVAELMSDVVADQKAGKLTAVQVAEKALALAGRAETEPVKLLLIQGAVMGFARGGEPARAAEAMQRMKAEIKDVTPEYEADILARAVKTVPAKSGSLLYAMLDDAKRLVKFRKDIPVIEKKLERIDTLELRMELAERLASLGEWKRALEMFVKMDGDVARAAKFERGELTGMTASEVADIWWAQKGVKDYAGYTVFQRHAGEWYKKALADGSLKGLKRDLAQKRIDGMMGRIENGELRIENGGGNAGSASDGAQDRGQTPVELQSGERPKDLVFKLDSKTNLEMVGIPAGKFTMGYEEWEESYFVSELCKPHEVTITRQFWAAKYPVTIAMCTALKFNSIELENLRTRAKNKGFTPDEIRMIDCKLPEENIDEFFAVLNKRIRNRPKGYVFRPPTMAEWEYCLKADGSDEALLRQIPTNIDKVGGYIVNFPSVRAFQNKMGLCDANDSKKSLLNTGLVPLNLFKPNPWGLHRVLPLTGDLILDTVDEGDVEYMKQKDDVNLEQILRVKGTSLSDKDPVFIGKTKSPKRLLRGMVYFPTAIYVARPRKDGSFNLSVRIVLGPDLVAEQAKKK